jgi:hypothetical protein
MLAPTARGEQIPRSGARALRGALALRDPLVALFVLAAGTLSLACGPLLGIDDGQRKDDASAPGAPGSSTGARTLDGGALDPSEASSDPGSDASSPGAPDSPGAPTGSEAGASGSDATTGAPDDGSTGEASAPCVPDPLWCPGRCDRTTDNCGNPVDCGGCDGGITCLSNACGCAPDNAYACAGRCQTSVVNNCGQNVLCGSCPSGQECAGTLCCAPSGCSGDCIDSCGLTNQSCCQAEAGPPPDAGGGGGGPCIAMGSGCSDSSACCSGACSTAGLCVSACGGDFAQCGASSPLCCIGFTCQSFIEPLASAATSSQPAVVTNSRCQ